MNTMYPINHLEEVKVKQTKNLKEVKTFHFMNISSGSRPGRRPSSATNNAGRSGSAAELQNIRYIK